VFLPIAKGGAGSGAFVNVIVKASAPPQALGAAVIERIHRVDNALYPTVVAPMSDLVAKTLGQPYFYARLFGVLAAVALSSASRAFTA
jgi:hypothetical protein